MLGGNAQVAFVERSLAGYAELRRIGGALKFKEGFVGRFTNNPPPVIVEDSRVGLLEFMDQIDCPIFVNVE